MTICAILVGRLGDIDNGATPHKVMTHRDYLAHPALFNDQPRPRIINLSRAYRYQSRSYYASLLGEARGHRVIPSVETIIDLSERRLYENAIPELEDALNRTFAKHPHKECDTIHVHFGFAEDPDFERFGRLLFDWFRAPSLEVTVKPGEWAGIQKIGFANIAKFHDERKVQFEDALARYTKREWRAAKPKAPARYSFATLCDPNEVMPPSSVSTLKYWAKIAGRLGVDVEPIGRKELSRLANYDALFIRETTSISNHTYRFARRAQQENMPVIDDPISMIRCTNKVYLHERLQANDVAVPQTLMIAGEEDMERVADSLGFPLVIKIPDSSFSRGVKKVKNFAELKQLATLWLQDSDLLLAQKYMPTAFDWRVGVLDGKPLFACQYMMAKNHWQIIKHDTGGKPQEGGFRSFALGDAPPLVLETSLRAARCIGDGLYGVDLKEGEEGVVVIEVNDNPNLEHGVEDAAEKDAVWINLTRWFTDRLDRR